MICPNCQHVENFVMRTDAVAVSIKRRRECCRCRHRWNTYETTENVMDELSKLKRALAPVAEIVK